MRKLSVALTTAWVCLFCNGATIADEKPNLFRRSVQRIEAGVKARQEGTHRWNRVVMLAKPRISSGDTEAVTGFIQQTASRFVLTILASVDGSSDPATKKGYRLAEVGVGHSVQVGDDLVVILPDDYEAHGARLSFLERQVLVENQRQFAEIQTIVRTSTLLMFDVPSLLFHDGQHQDFVMRHLVWIDSNNGNLLTLIWLLKPLVVGKSGASSLQLVASVPISLWDGDQLEDRAIHVDGREFTLGIPSKRAFALEKMPTGHAIAWNEAAREVAALSVYDEESLRALLTAINHAMEQPKNNQ